jgi:Tfp pilus assembly protein PilE
MRRFSGFTLIELMIVINAVDVLVAVAIPAYQGYLNSSKLTEALAFVYLCRVGVNCCGWSHYC